MTKVRSDTGVTARALEFICLTAARSGEAVATRWDEIDLDARSVDGAGVEDEGRQGTPRAIVGARIGGGCEQ
jgi:hypothetical protein